MVPLYHHSKTSLALVFISFIMLPSVDHVCPDPEESNCFDEAQNDIFQYNVDVLLQNLALEAYKSSFYSSTSGTGIQTVNGLYLCRGLVTQQVCLDCIGSAFEYLAETCIHNRAGIVWYEDCLLRYSGYDISSVENHAFGHYDCNPPHPSDMVQYNLKFPMLVDGIFGKAAYGSGNPSFATGEAKISDAATIYGLAQCTPDITGDECNQCLRAAIDQYDTECNGKPLPRAYLLSCQVRFELFPFY